MGQRWAGLTWCTRAGVPGLAHIPPTFSDGYEGCRSARTFKARLRASIGSVFCDGSVTGRPTRAFEMDIGRPDVDALMFYSGTRFGLKTFHLVFGGRV